MTLLAPEMIERVRALRAEGRSMTGIGAVLGLTKGQVAGMLHRMRHPTPKRPAVPQRPPRPPFYADSPGPGACCWPTSEGRPWRFCSQDREPGGGVYCPAHRRAATAGRSWHAEAA